MGELVFMSSIQSIAYLFQAGYSVTWGDLGGANFQIPPNHNLLAASGPGIGCDDPIVFRMNLSALMAVNGARLFLPLDPDRLNHLFRSIRARPSGARP